MRPVDLNSFMDRTSVRQTILHDLMIEETDKELLSMQYFWIEFFSYSILYCDYH